MQSHDWNDLKHFLALFRTGKLKDAAYRVGASETTVTRRIRALEQDLGSSLFLRSAAGRYEPTDAALQILPQAEAIEQAHGTIEELSGTNAQHVTGCVRISSVPVIVNRLLVPNLAPLMRRHPGLEIELVPSSDNLDLSKREADLAIRFARPASGGLRTKAQKLGRMPFEAYAAKAMSSEDCAALGWVSYDAPHAHLPQARWMQGALAGSCGSPSGLRVADAETALEAVANGLGISLLPQVIGGADPRLRSLSRGKKLDAPSREIWLLSHVDQSARLSVLAVKEWLVEIFSPVPDRDVP